MTEIPATIDLDIFCGDPELTRYSLARPWRSGDFVQATDGKVAIQIDASLAPEVAEPDGRVPNFDDILSPVGSITNWQPCPAVADCAACQNTGKQLTKCDLCNGSARCECACGNEHECGNCDDGLVFAAYCKACEFHFAGRQLQHGYMLAIAKLPACELGTASDDPDMAVFFRFTGGVGAIMPVNE